MGLGNILESALTLLPPVSFEYRTYVVSKVNELGISVPKYTNWSVCRGMVQPVEASRYADFGLDYAKRAITVWGSIDLNTLDVQDHPDQVRFQGRVFNCERCTDWLNYNGWHTFICTEDKRVRKDTEKAHNPTVINVVPDIPHPLPQEGGGVRW